MEQDGYKIPVAEECLGYSNLGCIEIRLDSMKSFTERLKSDNPKEIWSCWGPVCDKFAPRVESNSKYEVEPVNIFFYVNGSNIISASSDGFETIADYLDADALGFYGENGRNLLNEIRKIYKNQSFASIYYHSKKYGYPNSGIFLDYLRFYGKLVGYEQKEKEFNEAKKLKYHHLWDFKDGNSNGYKNGTDYYEAKDMEIRFSCDYEDYKVLTELSEKYGFKRLYEFHIFHILSRYRGGQRINLKEVHDIWYNESFYYDAGWYEIDSKDKTKKKLQEILSTGEKFVEIGKIGGEPPEFVLYRSKIIYVDGSNVAWNNGSKNKGDRPHARNIKITAESLKSRGFTNVVALCDGNLFHLVDDQEVYKELKEEGILYQVRGNQIADEWLIKFRKNKDIYIVSNDRFRDYLKANPGLEDHIIKFQVAGSEATFDETLDKVIDGIELDGDLPRLCREINDFI